MAESEKRRREKKSGGRKSPPRPGKNSEGTKRKDGPPSGGGGLKPQLAGAMGPPGAPPTAVEPPPSPSPMPPGMGGPPPPGGPGAPGGGVAGAMSMATGGAPPPGALPGTVPPQTTGAAPPTLGPGFPDDLQGMPSDQQALLQLMQTGFGPGASQSDFDAGMSAASQVRAKEAEATRMAFSQNEDQMEVAELGRLMAAILRRRAGQGNPAPTANRGGLPL